MSTVRESKNSSVMFLDMLSFYASLAAMLLALYAAGAFPVIVTRTIEPAAANETRKGRFFEVTWRELWFRKGPFDFIIGSYVRRRPADDG